MFVKPFRTKTNARIRGSDRKHLRAEIEKSFGSVENKESLSSIATNKDEINVLKIFTHKKELATVYIINKNPLFFEVDKLLVPTVYFLWKHPGIVPSLTTHAPVISKLANGADLMLPGVVLPSAEHVPTFPKGSVVAVNADTNLSPVAIGIALKSSQAIFCSKDRQGKAIQILHVFGDHLWEIGERLQPPKRDPPPLGFNSLQGDQLGSSNKNVKVIPPSDDKDLPSDDTAQNPQCPEIESAALSSDDLPSSTNALDEEEISQEELLENIEEKMNELLHNCVFTAIKVKLKDKELPFPAGTFYRMKVLSCCPREEFLDIKKTSYKKLGKYLKHLEKSNLIEIKELTKGNDHIVAVNRAHADLRSFQPMITESEDASDDVNTESHFGVLTQKHYEPPEISLLYGVNSATSSLFNLFGCSKGTTMESSQIRQMITDYVRENELISGQYVNLDPVLHKTVFGKGGVDIERIKWDALFAKIFDAMQIYHQLKFKGAKPIVKKGPPPKIIVKLEQRTGNKKVTLVQNLEYFLIRPQEFADLMRKKAQASTSVTTLAGSKPTQPLQQILIQGTQIGHIEDLLTGDIYKLPRKYIDGLQLAPKSKGNKRK